MSIKLFILCVSMTLVSCASQNITTDYQAGYDFASLNNYFLMDTKEDIIQNPKVSKLDLNRIEKSLSEVLNKRYKPVEKNEADFLVRYHRIVEGKTDVKSYEASLFHKQNWYYYGLEHDNVYTVHYQVGSIIVDFLDTKTEEVIWRGVTQSRIKNNSSPQQKRNKITEEMNKLLQLFPPKQLQ